MDIIVQRLDLIQRFINKDQARLGLVLRLAIEPSQYRQSYISEARYLVKEIAYWQGQLLEERANAH